MKTGFTIARRGKCLAGLGACAGVLLATGAAFGQDPAQRQDASNAGILEVTPDPDVVARDLVAAMTPKERLQLLQSSMPILVPVNQRPDDMIIAAGYVPGIPRLGLPALRMTDASMGVANLNNLRKDQGATALPSTLAIAASWDVGLAERAGAMIGSEARAKGFNVMLAGGVNLGRDARNGRNFEYFGEDPLLSGMMAGHSVKGVQSAGVISTVKHFALNDQETGRSVVSVNMDEAVMRESDLLAFEIAIGIGDPGAIMCAYNRVNAIYTCENEFLLNRVLRDDWGFEGWVMSDWGSVHSTEALMKGLDQQSGKQIDPKPYFGSLLETAIGEGRIPQQAADRAAHRIVRTMVKHGVIDNPAVPGGEIDFEAHAKVAQEAAESGIVLLKNENDILPIAASAKRIAVIGPNADAGVMSGGGSSQVAPVGGAGRELPSPLEGIARQMIPSIVFMPSSPLEAMRAALPSAEIVHLDGVDVAKATQLARNVDLVVMMPERWEAETVDAADLSLGNGQDELIAAVAEANPATVVVLQTGNPVTMPWLEKVPAVLQAWYSGQRGGTAIANVLTGAVNPSGHLPMTFPADESQLPLAKIPGSDAPPLTSEERAVYGLMAGMKPFEMTYPEGADVGYRWFEKTGAEPLFPFGHGLSYTSFAYDGLAVVDGETLVVSFAITNSGQRAGSDVAQVYARVGDVKRLVGWRRVTLSPGETKRVDVTADPRLMARFDVAAQKWVLDGGRYEIEVGTSSRDTALDGEAAMTARSWKP